MLSIFWNTIIVNPIFNVLAGFYAVTGNLGISIILLTLVVRSLLLPLMLPSMKSMKKQRELMPEIDKLKKKYADDKVKLAEAQMKLFKEHGINPGLGCLIQIPVFIFLIALYSVIQKIYAVPDLELINSLIYFDAFKLTSAIDTHFLYLDLSRPDPYYALAVISGVLQYFTSKISFPVTKKGEKIAKDTPDKMDDLAYNVSEQMLYTMPIVTVLFSLSLPSGAVLYIVTTTLFSLVQTYLTMGGSNGNTKLLK